VKLILITSKKQLLKIFFEDDVINLKANTEYFTKSQKMVLEQLSQDSFRRFTLSTMWQELNKMLEKRKLVYWQKFIEDAKKHIQQNLSFVSSSFKDLRDIGDLTTHIPDTPGKRKSLNIEKQAPTPINNAETVAPLLVSDSKEEIISSQPGSPTAIMINNQLPVKEDTTETTSESLSIHEEPKHKRASSINETKFESKRDLNTITMSASMAVLPSLQAESPKEVKKTRNFAKRAVVDHTAVMGSSGVNNDSMVQGLHSMANSLRFIDAMNKKYEKSNKNLNDSTSDDEDSKQLKRSQSNYSSSEGASTLKDKLKVLTDKNT